MDQTPYPCDHPAPIEQEPHHHLVLANDFVRAFAVEIAPHDRTLCHHHEHEYLMYVAGDAQIVSAPHDGDQTTHSYHDGYCELSPPGLVHVVENLAGTKFRNLLLEFLPGLGDLQRGGDPKIVAGDARIARLFTHDHASVFLLDIKNSAKVGIYGPAVVASPYENEVELAVSQEDTHKLAHFRDLSWLSPATGATWSNHGETGAKVVLFAVGR
jgi:hypothetical protein